MDIKKIVVVGGGPAGMMAAIRASQLKQDVTLIERNAALGKKLLLSGKGRCNLTNACDLDSFLNRFHKNGQFLRDAFNLFFNKDLINFFEKRSLRLKIERQSRIFPVSDDAGSILEVLKKELCKNKVRIIFKATVKDILLRVNEVKGVVLEDGRVVPADRLILATGGASYRFTGSTGEGFDIARRLGHSIVLILPGLVALETKQDYPKLLEGLTLKNIRLKFNRDNKRIISDIGELLFTSFGISGPLVLSLSGIIVDWLNKDEPVSVEIDLKPALSMEQVNARLLTEFKINPRKEIKNTLRNLLPKRLVNIFLDMAKVIPDKKGSEISQEERKNLVLLFKGLRLDITGSRPIEEAMITRGGVSLKEISPRTMESRIVKKLYFAGEMIDVDADTGGFNMQAAFSTGYLAGESAALN